MSVSKFIMAQKLQRVQSHLMGVSLNFLNFEELLSVIFQACYRENLTFWFNFHEDYCVLNLRDTGTENYELNIRSAYVGVPLTDEGILENKMRLLKNAFLLTEDSIKYFEPQGVDVDSEINIIEGDKPVPKHISKAIEVIQSKGIPVTVEAIRNHLPLNEMSTSARLQCNKYLKEMEES